MAKTKFGFTRAGVMSLGVSGVTAPPDFGGSVNHISTRGADYAYHSTMSPPGFSDLATALNKIKKKQDETTRTTTRQKRWAYEAAHLTRS